MKTKTINNKKLWKKGQKLYFYKFNCMGAVDSATVVNVKCWFMEVEQGGLSFSIDKALAYTTTKEAQKCGLRILRQAIKRLKENY